jgi:O-antigen/teichoic acid export membrane protein
VRTKKALFNLIFSFLKQIITAVAGFILPYMFISEYGSEINGLLSSVKQFLAHLNIVEAGIGAASIVALYKPLAKKDHNQINLVLSATKIFYKRVSYFFAFLVLLLAILYPNIVGTQIEFYISFILVLILGFSGFFEFSILGKYRVLLLADQRSYVISLVQTISTIINTAISVILIKFGYHFILVQLIYIFTLLLQAIIIVSYIKYKFPKVHFNDKTPDYHSINRKWDALIHQVAGLIVFSTPLVLVTIFLGLNEASVYAIYNMIFLAVGMFVSSFSNGLSAGFGSIISANDHVTLGKTHNTFEYFYFLVLTWVVTCTALLIIPFITVYTSGIHDVNYIRPELAALFVLVMVLNYVRIPSQVLVEGAGHFKETKYRAILEALINFIVSLIFIQFLGLEGLLLGAICSFLYRTTDFILYTTKHILKGSIWGTLRRLITNMSLSLIASIPFVFIFPIKVTSYFEWFSWAIIVSIWVLVIVLAGNALFDIKAMREILRRFKSVFNSFKK